MLHILSSAAWVNMPTGYAASTAAMWSATNALEVLADDHTQYLKSRLSTKAEEFYPWLDEQIVALTG